MENEGIMHSIQITAMQVMDSNEVYNNPVYLTSEENNHTVFNLNKEGKVDVFYNELTDLDKEFWDEEIQENKHAQSLQEKIDANLNIGYSWSVKRTMGQPSIVSLYYGYLAIAIAILTDGIIYSDDGAWDYSSLPMEGNAFKEEYLHMDKISDVTVKENVKKWLAELKKLFDKRE